MAERGKRIVIEIHVLVNIAHGVDVNKSERLDTEVARGKCINMGCSGITGSVRTEDGNRCKQIVLYFVMVVQYRTHAKYSK